MNIKAKIYINIIILLLCVMKHSLFSMTQRNAPSLQQQAYNSLCALRNLRESMQTLSTLPQFCQDFSGDINDFVLCNNLEFCRVIMLNFLASTQHYVSILSELSDEEAQNIQHVISEKTLCKKHKLFTAGTDGVLSSLDLLTKEMLSVKRQNVAFSCINANSKILATAQVNSNIIRLWNITDLSEIGFITTQTPTAHIKIIKQLLIVLNTAGDIDFYSLNSGKKLCCLKTGIPGIIDTVSWNKISKIMFVTTTKGRYIISLGDMTMADQLLHNLSINQLVLFAYILQNSKEIVPEKLELDEIFKSLPVIIKSMIQYLFRSA